MILILFTIHLAATQKPKIYFVKSFIFSKEKKIITISNKVKLYRKNKKNAENF